MTFNNGVTGNVTACQLTSLTVGVSGLSSLTSSTALDASVTVDGVSSGSPVQVATLVPWSPPTRRPGSQRHLSDYQRLRFRHHQANDSVTFDNGVTGTATHVRPA